MIYERSLFVFRRDFRLEDNTALIKAMGVSRCVIVAFIFDPRQSLPPQLGHPHGYFSVKAASFLRQSLDDLTGVVEARGGRLFRFYGPCDKVVTDLISRERIDAVFVNKDHTPFSIRRDSTLRVVCQQHGVAFDESEDVLLCPAGSVLKSVAGTGGPYTVFTSFYKKALTLGTLPVQGNSFDNFFKGDLESNYFLKAGELPDLHEVSLLKGGRAAALDILSGLDRCRDYAAQRDIPALGATTHLSPYLKFGTVSVREVRQAVAQTLGPEHPILRQLYWRDFFSHIVYHFPHVFGSAFYDEYNSILWQNDELLFAAWCEGRTGFPLVDAGMRELNATGFMHNRVRMVAASFLVKDLHIDWRWGEKYFAGKLVDYDPSVNNGNWQWAASTGCDHQPYFRIFNPVLQQKRFDPSFIYVRRWVPEFGTKEYPTPVIDHTVAAAWAKEAFRNASRRKKNV
ncbi:MAG: deoxyribodipyrimidine photo-lyase [Candidatus Omnitrophota bacterium]